MAAKGAAQLSGGGAMSSGRSCVPRLAGKRPPDCLGHALCVHDPGADEEREIDETTHCGCNSDSFDSQRT